MKARKEEWSIHIMLIPGNTATYDPIVVTLYIINQASPGNKILIYILCVEGRREGWQHCAQNRGLYKLEYSWLLSLLVSLTGPYCWLYWCICKLFRLFTWRFVSVFRNTLFSRYNYFLRPQTWLAGF